jgi:hypothetical protein
MISDQDATAKFKATTTFNTAEPNMWAAQERMTAMSGITALARFGK